MNSGLRSPEQGDKEVTLNAETGLENRVISHPSLSAMYQFLTVQDFQCLSQVRLSGISPGGHQD